jgi:two-component system OmpR family response regulator/two-component system alkaline phosphatase synthesis response regulator PhoP
MKNETDGCSVLSVGDLEQVDTEKRHGGVLVIDDDGDIRHLLSFGLEIGGLHVTEARDGMEALHLIEQVEPEVIVLDLMMPGMSGLEVLERIRAKHRTPVLICSALASDENVIFALEKGADDYVTKPFNTEILEARVKALMRRAWGSNSIELLQFEGLMIDSPRRQVTLKGEVVEFTAKEFELLAHLANFPGRVFTRHELLRDVWHSSGAFQQEATITEHIRRVRVKIEDDPEKPTWIQTVRGVGYKFERRRKPR